MTYVIYLKENSEFIYLVHICGSLIGRNRKTKEPVIPGVCLYLVSWLAYVANKSAGAAFARLTFKLQGGVRYVEMLSQLLIDCGYNLGTSAYHLVLNNQMSTQSMYPRSNRPDVNIMHFFYTGTFLIVSITSPT